ncbi:MAG TPA: hypothetical protein VMM79_06695 [Longimicrobiales bacterium]|nr:hypothetical protein [Longimicrobiales bacterium]
MNAVVDRTDAWRGPRRAVAVVIGLLAVAPLWRLLDRPEVGLAGQATVAMTESFAGMVWAGLAILAIPALLASRLMRPGTVTRAASSAGRVLESQATLPFAVSLALVAFAAAAAFGRFALDGQPNLVDAMSQLLHARFMADGSLAGPGPSFGEFWMPQQSLFSSEGWVSQYPPGHIVLLALGMKAGIPWAVGPFMLALTVFFTSLAAERLLPGRLAVARLGAVLVAVSPFMIAHAGAWMNHTTAAAFGAIAIWCAVRAAGGPVLWMVLAGAATGVMFTTRPLSALTLATVIAVWLASAVDRRARLAGARAAGRVLAIVAGALPFGLLVGAYNAFFFGSPTTFGYAAALGPAGGPGFGLDPWGNTYGLVEAVGYTSAELTALSLFLLETPLPLVALIAVWLAWKPRLEHGERLIAGWALAPVAAQALYWHHGLFMGPRMLNEVAPAWCLLAAIAVTWLVARLPASTDRLGPYSPRVFGAVAAVAALLAGLLVLAPMRLASYTQRPAAPGVALAAAGPAIVFVHGGWTSRLSARLAASGMRLDSVETAMRQNPTCAVQAFADALVMGHPLPTLDFERRAVGLPRAVEISPGNRIRVAAGERLAGECARQAAADRFGTIDVTPLLWLGSVPGDDTDGAMQAGSAGGIMFARDMGPTANARLLTAFSGRTPLLLATRDPDMVPELMDYATAMQHLWGDQ